MLVLMLCGMIPAFARAQTAEPAKPRLMSLSPAAVPSPIFTYRLLPMSSELNPGDAAPIYLRIRHEILGETWKEVNEKCDTWGKLSPGDFPVKDARALVDQWSGRLKLLEYGSRREFCDWSFTLPEQKLEAFDILLPDAAEMRIWGGLLALKARVLTAEHQYREAVGTIETGLAFARHVGKGPFLINALIGISIGNQMTDRLEELVSQPAAPNLYWALSALPRPLVGTRDALELERKLPESLVPELNQTRLTEDCPGMGKLAREATRADTGAGPKVRLRTRDPQQTASRSQAG